MQLLLQAKNIITLRKVIHQPSGLDISNSILLYMPLGSVEYSFLERIARLVGFGWRHNDLVETNFLKFFNLEFYMSNDVNSTG